jgi:hypothetical protein
VQVECVHNLLPFGSEYISFFLGGGGVNNLGETIWLFGEYNSQIHNAAFSYMGDGGAASVYSSVRTSPGLRSEF